MRLLSPKGFWLLAKVVSGASGIHTQIVLVQSVCDGRVEFLLCVGPWGRLKKAVDLCWWAWLKRNLKVHTQMLLLIINPLTGSLHLALTLSTG